MHYYFVYYETLRNGHAISKGNCIAEIDRKVQSTTELFLILDYVRSSLQIPSGIDILICNLVPLP